MKILTIRLSGDPKTDTVLGQAAIKVHDKKGGCGNLGDVCQTFIIHFAGGCFRKCSKGTPWAMAEAGMLVL